jgi:hypothetical protein
MTTAHHAIKWCHANCEHCEALWVLMMERKHNTQ